MEKGQVIEFGNSTAFGGIQKVDENKVPDNPIAPESKEEPGSDDGDTGATGSKEEPGGDPTPDPGKEPSTEGKTTETGEEGSEDGEGSDEPKKPNVYRALADILKSDGVLPEDVEVPEDADSSFIEQTLQQVSQGKVREQVLSEVQRELENQGINEHRMNMLLMLENGRDPSTITQMGRLESFSKLNLEDLAENEGEDYTKRLDEVIYSMYELKGYSEKDIKRMMKAIDSEEEKEKIFKEEAQPYHKEAYDSVVKQEKELAQQRVQYEKQMRQYEQQLLNDIFTTKKIADEPFPDDQSFEQFQRSILAADRKIQTPDGQEHPVTEFQSFLYDFQNNLEFQLYLFKNFKFRDVQVQQKADEVRKKVEEELEAGLRSVQENPGDPEKQIEQQKQKNDQRLLSEQMIIDLSNM